MSEESATVAMRRLFQQAVSAFTQHRYADAQPLLERAAEGHDAEAQNLLGIMLLNGMGVTPDVRRAAVLFEAAAAGGLKEAHYNLANIKFNAIGAVRDEAAAQRHLLAAARAGHRPSLRSLGFIYHAAGKQDRWPALATHCFRLAAEAGDPLAQYIYGLRLNRGHGTPADPLAAADCFAAAAQAGVYLARERLAEVRELTQSRTQLPAARADEELPPCLLPELPPAEPARTVAFMSEHRDALDEYLGDHLINVAAPRLMPSGVVDPDTGAAVHSELRTSHSMHFQPSMYDAAVYLALRRIAWIAGSPPEHAEPLGVLRYGPGQEYRPHYDYYTDDRHEVQRVATVFVYLNEVAEGGGTDFPRLAVKVDPERGKAVKFLNCTPGGEPNPDTLHAGLPVVRGEKWLATLWFWDRPFRWFG